jgi:hypothetical protein
MKRRTSIIGGLAALAAGAVTLGIVLASGPQTAKAIVVNPPGSGRPNIVQVTRQGGSPAQAARAADAAALRYVASHPRALIVSWAIAR